MNLVDCNWLNQNLNNKNICILDCSWHLPNVDRNGKDEFLKERIPNSIYFDIDFFSDEDSSYPHMLSNKESFSNKVSDLGIKKDDHIICYDVLGIFTSPRVAWMFKQYGHENISILDGGFKNWKLNNLPIETDKPISKEKSEYKASQSPTGAVSFEDVKKNIDDKEFILVDARPSGRYNGTDPEPRKELQSGSIKGSINIPFSNLIDSNTGCLKNDEELKKVFDEKLKDQNQSVVFSCGSGVAAVIAGMAYQKINKKSFKIYDGSWTEWAIRNKIFK